MTTTQEYKPLTPAIAAELRQIVGDRYVVFDDPEKLETYSHDEIAEAWDAWEARAPRFGHVEGHGDVRIPAPPLPNVRLTRRRRRT